LPVNVKKAKTTSDEIRVVVTRLFVKRVLFVHVRFAVQLSAIGERRSSTHFLMVVVVRRPSVVPRVHAVFGLLVETHLVQVQEHALRLVTDRGHGVVVGRLARVAGHSQRRPRHRVAPEVRVLVRRPVVRERIPAHAGDERFAAVGQRVRGELAGDARQIETAVALHVQTAAGVRVNDRRDVRAVRRKGHGHFQRAVFRHPQSAVIGPGSACIYYVQNDDFCFVSIPRIFSFYYTSFRERRARTNRNVFSGGFSGFFLPLNRRF